MGESFFVRFFFGTSIAVLFFGFLCKIMHWPFAGLLIISAISILIVLSAIKFWFKPDKQKVDYLKAILIFFWAVNGMIYMVIDRSLMLPFKALSWGSFIAWLLVLGYQFIFENDEKKFGQSKKTRYTNVIFNVGAVTIVLGAIMKIFHWPGAGIMLVVGIGLGAIWFFLDSYKKGE